MPRLTFVLVHGPLVGPHTWAPVADALRARGAAVVAPSLVGLDGQGPPYWRRHVEAVVRAVAGLPEATAPYLVGHGGAGVLLPAIREGMGRPVGGYIFVDAAIPRDGASRLDLFGSPREAAAFRASAADGRIPTWTEDDLRQEIPDAERRRQMVSELRPLPLAVYEERVPVFAGWPDAPCGYLCFSGSEVCAASVAHALAGGWAYRELPGRHFHILVAPDAVAWALLDLAGRLDPTSRHC